MCMCESYYLESLLKFLFKVFSLWHQITLRWRRVGIERIGHFASVDHLLEPVIPKGRGAETRNEEINE